MPYVPVQRDAGRIMYESAMQRAQSMGQTARNITDFLYQKDEENKAFGAKLKSLETLLQTHSDKFGLDEDQLKQFLSVDPNESPKERYLRVGGFIEGTMKASDLEKEKVAREESQARAKQSLAQAEKLEQEKQLTEEDIKFWKDLDARARAEEAAAGRTIPPGLNPNIPASIQQFGGPADSPSPTPSSQTTQAAPAASRMTAQDRPSAVVTTDDLFKAKMQLGPRATPAQVSITARANAAARAKEFRPEGLYGSRTEARTASKELDQNDPVQGFVRTEEYDPQAKAFVIKLVQKPETAESKIAVAGGQEAVKTRVANASANLAKVRTGGMQARDDLPRLDRMQAALEAGARTGFMAPEIAGLTSALVEIGLYPEGKQATIEQLIADAGVDALQKARYYMDNQGSVSESERKRVDSISQSARTNPKALLEMVKISRAYALRQDAADNYRRTLLGRFENDPMREVKINDMMDEWWADNSIRKFEKAGSLGGQSRQSADDIYNEVMGGKR